MGSDIIINNFYRCFENKYLTKNDVINIRKKFKSCYKINKKEHKNKKFRKDYLFINRKKHNKNYIKKELEESKNLLDDICGYKLDNKQRQIVVTDEEKTLVIAGAGSGKSLTIIGKIRYLIERKNVNPNDILCISFTNEACNSLKNKLNKYYNYDINVLTFHKLGLNIIKENNIEFNIASEYLELVIREILEQEEIKKFLKKYYSNDYINQLYKLISTFIHLYKSSYDNLNYYQKIIKKNINKKEKILLKLIYKIHSIYELELKSQREIDFDDMLHIANKLVLKNGLKKKYKYIIIDEYQDTSYVKFNLIKNVLEKTNAYLLAVGDDFQSIYRFTGCNLDIFVNFKKYFKDSNIMKIENTYRNSLELIKITSKFILKNKRQIKKKLYSNKHIDNPIKYIYYNNKKIIFKKLIVDIYNKNKDEIMILGRNNKDIYSVIDKDFILNGDNLIYIKNNNIKMKYYTVHKSKGLESDNVIIINMEDKLLGFPSQIEDDRILRFVLNKKEYYPYEEERRLFYVALTRTKNSVYLLIPTNRKSIFVDEIKKVKFLM